MPETTEIPFVKIGNYTALTDEQIISMPWLGDFIKRFPNCFEYDRFERAHYFWPEGKQDA